ncbi:hypothetical protein AVEN_25695-1 [Araneus ventricosus]|uniref:EGF-like domain-containing protein n=1 Tax=Araneus ventricosus TaxID=182803 RepID=A0A4Y2L0E7_ARAVE|nr:hypothetical protein AVEN_25695-1 [Araneus ventricosus]
MRYAGKEAILLLFLNALHVQCGTVLKTQNINETDSVPSLKGYEWAACICENGICVNEGGKNICKCNPGYGNFTVTKCKACNCGPDTSCTFIDQGFFKPYLKECLCKPGYHEEKGKCVELPSTSTPTTTILSTTVTTEQSKETAKTTIDHSSTIDRKTSSEIISPVSPTSIPSTVSTKDPELPSTSTPTTTILSTTVTTEQSKETAKTTIDQSSTIDGKTSSETTSPVSPTSIPSTVSTKDPDCNCGEYSKSCRYNWKGDKICDCLPGYAEKYGSCEGRGRKEKKKERSPVFSDQAHREETDENGGSDDGNKNHDIKELLLPTYKRRGRKNGEPRIVRLMSGGSKYGDKRKCYGQTKRESMKEYEPKLLLQNTV